MNEHEHWDELAAGYALDALEPDEHAEFAAHLPGCSRCRQAVDQHALVAAQLGSLAGDDADLSPPPWKDVRAGVVAEAATDPDAADADDADADADVVVLRPRPRWALLSAVAAVAAVVMGVTISQLDRGGSDSGSALASVAACRQADDCHVVPLTAGDSSPANVLVAGD